jgi:hypothetical protein
MAFFSLKQTASPPNGDRLGQFDLSPANAPSLGVCHSIQAAFGHPRTVGRHRRIEPYQLYQLYPLFIKLVCWLFQYRTDRLKVAAEIWRQEQRLLKANGIVIHSDAANLLGKT